MIQRKKKRDELVAKLLFESREELARADNKASILLAAAGIFVGAIVGAILAGEWSPFGLPTILALFWWGAVGMVALSIAFLGKALIPTISREEARTSFVGYFGDVVAIGRAGLEQALRDTVADSRGRDLDQLDVIAKIVQRKYRCIRSALLAFGMALLLLLGTAIGWAFFL